MQQINKIIASANQYKMENIIQMSQNIINHSSKINSKAENNFKILNMNR